MAESDDHLKAELARLYRSRASGGATARARLMERVRAARPPRPESAALAWWLEPRNLALPAPAWAAIALVLLALGASLTWVGQRVDRLRARDPLVASASVTGASQVVRFALEAPGASRVALVGDFNGWDPQASPMRRLGDTWALSVPVARGRHVYAFVVDGREWLSDPGAPLAPEDEFGFRKSVVVVGDRGPS